eukprot:8167888-Alexandrium_andersonii.AAC.1
MGGPSGSQGAGCGNPRPAQRPAGATSGPRGSAQGSTSGVPGTVGPHAPGDMDNLVLPEVTR